MKELAGTGMGTDTAPGTGTGTGTGTVPGAGSGAGSFAFTGPGTPTGSELLFDHEKLEVYRVAREFLEIMQGIAEAKLPREIKDQFERASTSILANIGEGAGKTSRADKRRFYEIARGSTTETATWLDVMRIRGLVPPELYSQARHLLLRVAQMLSRLVGTPRLA